ncbi:hypothetical protein EIP86_003933 [Pleurotus ostreatoroseus]|nr:hypothetical protein EIP86_003933 [Pleurotus ostreatoroseus]
MPHFAHALGLFSLCCVAVLYYAGVDIVKTLSPQGCRMSWMSPSYVLQNKFDRSWSPLADRYSLWLYREVGWEGNELHGAPVLFVPGNAGSSHQVRSIASSATRQFYSEAYQVAEEFRARTMKPLDFFAASAVEFNEDLTAFHGTTMDAQRRYSERAIDYILSLYPEGTSIIVMGHSMGGIVATSMLPHDNISAIITMSTPHTLPPARFDRRIDRIYSNTLNTLSQDPTPIISLCGGATDLMVPSEACILPSHDHLFDPPYRRTVFTSALEGCWSGVGHLAMVWCHQVRWRIARAALELGQASTPSERGLILDTWLRDGHTLPPNMRSGTNTLELGEDDYSVLPPGEHLALKILTDARTYLLPVPSDLGKDTVRFVLYVSHGNIGPVAPRHALPLRASVYLCPPTGACNSVKPSVLKLIPAPVPGQPFPVPDEGSDESEGVVLFEAQVPVSSGSSVALRVENADGRGWVVGGFDVMDEAVNDASAIAPFMGRPAVTVTGNALRQSIRFPNLLSSALVVYRLIPRFAGRCIGQLNPLVQHTSHPSETHYYPLASKTPILLHTHGAGPFISSPYTRGLNLTIFTSGEGGCILKDVGVTVDWWATIGRWGVRYTAPAATWAVAIVAVVLYDAWGVLEGSSMMPDVKQSLSAFVRRRLPWLLLLSFIVSFVPFPEHVWLGNGGEPMFAALAPSMLLVATGLVIVSWWVLGVLSWPLNRLHGMLNSHPKMHTGSWTSTYISTGLVCALILLLIPWQVAFLGCWLYHLYTCSAPRAVPPPQVAAIPLLRRTSSDLPEDDPPLPSSPNLTAFQLLSQAHEREHLLLLMTWLLPLTAPVLVVWVRTLYTAGLTTPFDGDHNMLCVLPYLVLVDASWGWGWVWRADMGRVALKGRWTMLVLAAVAFFSGPRATYVVFEVATLALGLGVLARMIQRVRDVHSARAERVS